MHKLLTDSTKAYDIADHTVSMSKVAKFQLPGNSSNRIESYLSPRRQVCRYNGEVSKLESFNLGFVQCSGLDPTLFLGLA